MQQNQKTYSGLGFEGICGQGVSRRVLAHLADTDRLPGTLLFTGPSGVGKLATALALAKRLHCREQANADCKCPSCTAIRTGAHPDVIVLSRDRRIFIDDMREIISLAGLRSAQGKDRFIILDRAETITREAANAALKTLEEPGEHVRFILITDIPAALLPTVRSRAYQLRFNLVGWDSMIEFAKAIGDDPTNDDTRKAAQFACGRPGMYLRLKHVDGYKEIVDKVSNWLKDVLETRGNPSLEAALEWKDDIRGRTKGKKKIQGLAELVSSIEKKSNLPRGADTFEIGHYLASPGQYSVTPINWRVEAKGGSIKGRWSQSRELLQLAGLLRRIVSFKLDVKNAVIIDHLHDFMQKVSWNCSFDIALERLYYNLKGVS